MEQHQIILGFSDIKLQFIKKLNLDKLPAELKLWFSLDEGVLYLHDYDKHETSIPIAIFENGRVKYYLDKRDFSIPLLIYARNKSLLENSSIAQELNELFDLYGTSKLNSR